jgi:chromosomal replication initiator protein
MQTALKEQHENWKAARERLFRPAVKPHLIDAPIEITKTRPLWRIQAIEFDDHVRLYRKIIRDYMAELSVEMRAAHAEAATELLPIHTKTPARDIIEDVLQHFPGVTWADLKGPRRTRAFVLPRQIAVYEVHRRRQDMSLPQIGRLFGGRDHTTALSSIRKIKRLLESGELKLPFATAE